MLVHKKAPPYRAWQYQLEGPRPEWVERITATNDDGELFHTRISGRQVLYPGEWLVRDMDGAVVYYSDEEFNDTFDRGANP